VLKYDLSINDDESSTDITFIEKELDKYNDQFAEPYKHRKLNIVLKDGDEIIAGLLGGTYWGWLYIDRFWIKEEYRKSGLGTKILHIAEEEAIKRGCQNVHLDTHDFQAVDFYKKNGYVVVSKLEDLPKGFNKYLMKKTFEQNKEI